MGMPKSLPQTNATRSVEIRDAHPDHRALMPGPSRLLGVGVRGRHLLVRGLLRPYSVHTPVERSNPAIVPEEDAAHFEEIVGPRVIEKATAMVRRPRQYHRLPLVLGVRAA